MSLTDRILKRAHEVCAIPTAPFREEGVREYIRAFCRDRKIMLRQDDMGNLIATYGGQHKGPVLGFCAHMDHPGFIAEKDSERGRLTARFYGGVGREYFKGTAVRFFTECGEVTGTVTSVRFNMKARMKRVFLDIEGPVRQGDIGMWDLPVFRTRGDRLISRSCDDTIGCIAVLALLDELGRRRVKYKVRGVFSVAEEGGLFGAKYLGLKQSIPRRTRLIAIETSAELPGARMGNGAVIRVGDSRSIFSPPMTAFLMHASARVKKTDTTFRVQRKLMDGGLCESSIYQQHGYTCGAMCIPLGNYHNRNARTNRIEAEFVSIRDLTNMVKLFISAVRCGRDLPAFLKPSVPHYREIRRDLGERLFL